MEFLWITQNSVWYKGRSKGNKFRFEYKGYAHGREITNRDFFNAPCWVVSLQRAGKYKRPAWQPSQEQKGLDEKPLRASQWRSHPW